MLGGIAIAIVILVVIPSLLFFGGAAALVLIGNAARADAERRHQGSELIDLNN